MYIDSQSVSPMDGYVHIHNRERKMRVIERESERVKECDGEKNDDFCTRVEHVYRT